jgi:hypothetical protein
LLSVQQNSGLKSPTDGEAMEKRNGLKCRECGRQDPAAEMPDAPHEKLSAHVAIKPSLSAFDQALANLKSQTS